jgi:hypothetical protein
MTNYFVKFQAICEDKISRLDVRLEDIENELKDLAQKREEALVC